MQVFLCYMQSYILAQYLSNGEWKEYLENEVVHLEFSLLKNISYLKLDRKEISAG